MPLFKITVSTYLANTEYFLIRWHLFFVSEIFQYLSAGGLDTGTRLCCKKYRDLQSIGLWRLWCGTPLTTVCPVYENPWLVRNNKKSHAVL